MEPFFRPDKPARAYVVIFIVACIVFAAMGGESDNPLADLFGWEVAGLDIAFTAPLIIT